MHDAPSSGCMMSRRRCMPRHLFVPALPSVATPPVGVHACAATSAEPRSCRARRCCSATAAGALPRAAARGACVEPRPDEALHYGAVAAVREHRNVLSPACHRLRTVKRKIQTHLAQPGFHLESHHDTVRAHLVGGRGGDQSKFAKTPTQGPARVGRLPRVEPGWVLTTLGNQGGWHPPLNQGG